MKGKRTSIRRILSFLASSVLLFSVLVVSASAEDKVIRIAGLKGPTSMGLVQLMEANDSGTAQNRYEFLLAGSADEVTPKLIRGEIDLAAVPSNLASVLYNNTNGAVRVLAVNTLGVLDIVEKNTGITSFSDLKGKTIYATGKGSTPEYTLRYLLQENGIDPDTDIKIEFKSEPTEVVAILSHTESGIAMLPQPYVTAALGSVDGLKLAMDLNEVWNATVKESGLVTGVLVGRSDFLEEAPETIRSFLDEYRKSVEWVTENPAEAAQLIEKFGIAKAAVAEKALPYCNITFLAGDNMHQALSGYLEVLFRQNPKAVGGKLPGEDFYYLLGE